MTKTQLLEKSRNYRNDCAIQRLAQLDSLKEWGQTTNTSTLPAYKKEKVLRDKVGWYNFVSLIKELKP